MRSIRPRALLAAASLIAATSLVLAGCTGGGDSGTAGGSGGDKVLNIASGVPPLNGLAPGLAGRGPFTTYITPAYEPLIRVAPDGTIEPALASAWEVSEDGTRLKFTLREDAKFSDGEEVNGEAVAQSILAWVEANGPFANQLATLTSAEATGPFEVTLTSSVPFPDMIYLFQSQWLAGAIIAPEAVADPELMKTGTYGAGPYVLDEAATVADNKYVYKPNEYYYDQSAIYWDEVVVNVFTDANSGISALRAGQMDFFPSDALTAFSNDGSLGDDISVLRSPGTTWTGLVLVDRDGSTNPAMGDVRVRQAINYALDRETLATALYGDFGGPHAQINGEGWPGYLEANEEFYTHDVDKAKELLAEAGYPDGVTIKNIQASGALNTNLAQAMAQQLAEAGITLETTEVPTYGELTNTVIQGEYSTMMYSGGYDTPALNAGSLFGDADGGYNPLKMHDPQLDAYIATAKAAQGDAADTAWGDVYTWITENAWWAVAAQSDNVWFVGKKIAVEDPGQGLVVDVAKIKPAA